MRLQIRPHDGDPVEVAVEVADDPESRRHGLMFRDRLGEREGMLFRFPDSVIRSFWMKNVLVPLDILFIQDGKVGHIASAVPMSERPISSGVPVQDVLELRAGFCEKHGVGPGAQVEVISG